MTHQRINPPTVFRSLNHGFSQAVSARGRTTLYVSRQVAWDANRALIGGTDLGSQARQAFRNLLAVLEAGGATPSDVVLLRIYVVNYKPEDAAAIGSAFREIFSSEAPATTWVGVAALADPELLVELEAIAVLE